MTLQQLISLIDISAILGISALLVAYGIHRYVERRIQERKEALRARLGVRKRD